MGWVMGNHMEQTTPTSGPAAPAVVVKKNDFVPIMGGTPVVVRHYLEQSAPAGQEQKRLRR